MKIRLPVRAPVQPGMFAGAAMIAALALVAGCQQNEKIQIDYSAPMRQVQTGDTLSLTSSLMIPQGSRKILFQNEQTIAPSALSPASPYCELVPEGKSPLGIPPGAFTVRSVNYSEQEFSGTDRMTSVTRIALSQWPFTDVYTLRCGWAEGAPRASQASFVSLDQIFNAVGGTFTLGVPK